LDKRGIHDFVLLEMESQAGGNSRWARTKSPNSPGAHYVPVPAKGESLARELSGARNLPRWQMDDRALCFDPKAPLPLRPLAGRHRAELGATTNDRDQYRRFNEKINQFRASGEFTIP